MSDSEILLGEFRRTIDDRYRLSIPPELADQLHKEGAELVLAKERPGGLGLYNSTPWQGQLDKAVDWVADKVDAGKLGGQVDDLLTLGRLLSTRHCEVQLAGRGRLVIPEGFRDFLGVAPGDPVFVVGAAISVEIWNPPAWVSYLEDRMPEFRSLLTQLSE